jgi:RNA polymerase sigma-70 factor, ECF subfamily
MESFKDQIFFRWYEDYSASIFKYIYAIVQEPQTAEDLMQETFLKYTKSMTALKK